MRCFSLSSHVLIDCSARNNVCDNELRFEFDSSDLVCLTVSVVLSACSTWNIYEKQRCFDISVQSTLFSTCFACFLIVLRETMFVETNCD